MKAEKILKRIVIGLVILLILTIIISSAKIYNVSQNVFEQRTQKMPPNQKNTAKKLRKVGEFQSKIAGKNRTGDSKLIDEIEKNNKKKNK